MPGIATADTQFHVHQAAACARRKLFFTKPSPVAIPVAVVSIKDT